MDDEFIEEGLPKEEAEAECSEQAPDKAELTADFIRDKSYEGLLTNAEDLLDEPLSLEVDEVLPLIDELKSREEFSDICIVNGAEKIYMFSEKYMTKNYSKMMILVEEKDMFKTIAETVREESRIYPRPTDVRLFGRAPFKLPKEEFYKVYEQLKRKEEYKDIQETRASNNALYLYSDKFLKKAHAASLAEWIEVEAEQNP